MKWHSCETQLTTVNDDWAKILDNQGQVDTVILDFEKAFDMSHRAPFVFSAHKRHHVRH